MEEEDQTKKPKPRPSTVAAPPVRTRWTPKPEQILILESIFNSGMVNPPKDETIRIRKLLEKFGSVGDANVFYWFQNRRSRSRRRQRQIQAAAAMGVGEPPSGDGGASVYNEKTAVAGGFVPDLLLSEYSGNHANSSDLVSFLGQSGLVTEFQQSPNCFAGDSSGLQFRQPDTITVFINGVTMEIGKGPLDVQGMFGYDFVVVHSSGAVVPVNEYGFLVDDLQHGESYFLVPRHC